MLLPTIAQAGEWEAWAGYSWLRDTTDRVTFPVGWTLGGGRSLASWLSVVGEIDGQRKTIPSIGSNIVLTSNGFTVGARASTRVGPFIEFAQLSSGVVRENGDAFGASSVSTFVVIQPGLGLDYPLGKRWAARGEVDVRRISTGQQLRAVAVLVYRRR